MIHPRLADAVAGFLPDTARVFKAPEVDPAPIDNFNFGYETTPTSAPRAPESNLIEVGTFACSYGQHRNREGKQTLTVDQVEIVVPWRVTFRNSPELEIKTGYLVQVGEMNLKVIVAPQPGSFDVLTKAYCQEIE